MAQRLATEYVKATLKLSETQMKQFLQMAEDGHIHSRVKVLGNGGQDIVLEDNAGEEVHFPFHRREGFYICELSCRLVNLHLTNLVRKLFLHFKGEGVVNRVYAGFTMAYVYSNGSVRKIVEVKPDHSRTVYEYKNTLQEMEEVFQMRNVERQITEVKHCINKLLDLRNTTFGQEGIAKIDEQLRTHTFTLFALEA
ncbi:non-ribosomal peptide synthetase module [Paenibacillus sp. Marseille-Q4541]|uniref:non-ribosomal peptide synthetase module n=1 Tax=Paenibacillus sp. Marseille-Q4541 TaxID=2831522 RepID=UPI001BA52D0C|nr:non-ribosomal peptide synthetase module [Paenibacillus sp. Marseille-Q4541]